MGQLPLSSSRLLEGLRAVWVAVFLLWAIAGRTSKQTVSAQEHWKGRAAACVVLFGWFLLFNRTWTLGPLSTRLIPETPATRYLGLASTLLGLAFAVCARFSIGRNWSAFVTLQADHRVVRTGPYAIVRHPIYSGFMLASLGTAIVLGVEAGLVGTALVIGAWGYKSRLEEAFLIEHFGGEYEEYRRRVKGLIPFVW